MKLRAVFAGSFDPVTYGHLDVIRRASRLFDHVVVACASNSDKSGLFTPEERLDLVRSVTGDLGNVSTSTFTGLVVKWAIDNNIDVMIRGLRGDHDLAYEMRIARVNSTIGPMETLFLPADPRHTHISSSLVRDLAALNADISTMVPAVVADALAQRLGGTQE
ncbi:pantetheine-phosphate adenylyltransferase [Stomatohabitans albus]|uniref:pantetheine-phosphate adenylyltransferase n=1 Tax=Stomatohabitans albus TaxID=3110766 RepID=UPI00300C011B